MPIWAGLYGCSVDESDLRKNPEALPNPEPPRIDRYSVNSTSLYVEVRGKGPAVLLIGAGDEDAYRPIAERLLEVPLLVVAAGWATLAVATPGRPWTPGPTGNPSCRHLPSRLASVGNDEQRDLG